MCFIQYVFSIPCPLLVNTCKHTSHTHMKISTENPLISGNRWAWVQLWLSNKMRCWLGSLWEDFREKAIVMWRNRFSLAVTSPLVNHFPICSKNTLCWCLQLQHSPWDNFVKISCFYYYLRTALVYSLWKQKDVILCIAFYFYYWCFHLQNIVILDGWKFQLLENGGFLHMMLTSLWNCYWLKIHLKNPIFPQ